MTVSVTAFRPPSAVRIITTRPPSGASGEADRGEEDL
jgi:hypothetical protein